MKYFPLGRPATEGSGPIRYSLRVPVWPGENVQISEVENLTAGDVYKTRIASQNALIEKREHFLVFKIQGLKSIAAAEDMWHQLSIALIRLSSSIGAALQFPIQQTEIARNDDPNIHFREQIKESEYPLNWTRRSDGTRTDGGIFPTGAYILPEHERIWEYNIWFGRIRRIVSLSNVSEFTSESKNFPANAIENNSIQMASHALWLACSANDRRIQFILLITTLDILARDENLPNWTVAIGEIISDIQGVIRAKLGGSPEGLLLRLSRSIAEIGSPGMADRIRSLTLRAFGSPQKDSLDAKNVIKEVNNALGKRAALAHGGKFLCIPTAAENNRLREIVAKALDQRMRDCGL